MTGDFITKPRLEEKVFECRGEVALFEIGRKTPDDGFNYVLNPETNQLEQIWSEEIAREEGEIRQRVETLPNRWYDVDGSTIFARYLRPIKNSLNNN